ncbi:KAP family P-loop NTPase fold protein [Corallibacter sp.]|uniref:KAP family P-loop NTPase fold protein n=1 Tax=Corallibacter sp. TaxID=2038084 RepID=UPI003AB1AC69
MNIVTPPITVGEDEAFEQDVLGRSNFGQSLLNLVCQSSDELVISLDGKWGEGKTTFVKMWKGMLNQADVPSIYIDAFANDYIDDAFIAVASAITTYIELNSVNPDAQKSKEFREKAKHVGVQLLSWTAKVGIKAATLGAIKDSDIDELKDIQSDVAKGLSTVVGDYVGERLASHKQDVELLQSFKGLLSEMPSLLSPEGDKPLVIIIDELDRCKPTYAVELIEKIKHLFSVKNVVFVLVMHRKQLEEAVKCIYGQNIDAHTYLQKFINIETTIPKKTGDRNDSDINQYNKKLFGLHQIETWGDGRNLVDSLDVLATHFNLSLRQLERVYTNLAVFYASSSKNQLRLVPIISFLAVIKVVDSSVYEALLHQKMTYEELCEKTGLSEHDQEDRNLRRLQFLAMWLKFSLITDEQFEQLDENDRIRGFGQSLWEYNVERNRLIPIFIQKLSMFTVS